MTGSKVISTAQKKMLRDEMIHCVKECKAFGYTPSLFIQDLANLDPVELVLRYVLAKAPTDGFTRLWEAKRLELTVEALAWRHRELFDKAVGEAARLRLKQYGSDVTALPSP